MFGTGMFQCLYQPGAAHWAMLPGTIEWQGAALLLGLAGALVSPLGWVVGAGMLGLSMLVAALQAAQARRVPTRRRTRARLLIAALCYAQPLVRSWTRYRTRLSSQRAPGFDPAPRDAPRQRLSWTGYRSVAYWSEAGRDRTEILERAVAFLDEHRWGRVLDTGWCEWDMAVYCDSGLILKVVTAQEDHGRGRRLIRIRYQLGPTARLRVIGAVSLVALAVVAQPYPRLATGAAALVLGLGVRAWVRGLAAATRVIALFRAQSHQMDMIECSEETRPRSESVVPRDVSEPAADPGDGSQSPPDPERAETRGAFGPAFRSLVVHEGLSPSENKEQLA
jgi:hypothetical protein